MPAMKNDPAKPPLPQAIRNAQFRDLNNRIQRRQHELMYGKAAPEAAPEPAAVKAARKLVNAYDERSEAATRRRRDGIIKRAAELRSLVLYGDVAKALRAVEKFENVASS